MTEYLSARYELSALDEMTRRLAERAEANNECVRLLTAALSAGRPAGMESRALELEQASAALGSGARAD